LLRRAPHMGFRERWSLLKNSFVTRSDSCLGAESSILGHFKPGSGPPTAPATAVSPGSLAL
jgi:hypothetical protein